MTELGLVAVAVMAGFAGSVLVDWRMWVGVLRDVRRHGLDNHLCDRCDDTDGCPPWSMRP